MTDGANGWHAVGLLGPVIWICAFLAASGLIAVLMPLFGRFAVAVPTARSSHSALTPQWGGLAVISATIGVAALVVFLSPRFGAEATAQISQVLLAAGLMAALGVVDDVRNLPPAYKLVVQAIAVVLVIAALPDDMHVLPFLPHWLERALLFAGGLWYVNLVNFMDGIDWMMVVEVVPVTAGIALVGALGALPTEGLIVALALNGAMLGFAPFNRPVARLFLGDMGSLPIALLLAWLLFLVAGSGHLAAALLLPLYFVADATVTLSRRLAARERVWEAHRSHFYQRAGHNGFTNWEIIGRVFAVNLALLALAAFSVVFASPIVGFAAVTLGLGIVAWLLAGFARRRP
jgi:UDP-N-acetylmuramyl pentapeptide phosphotransferase/UDP-N-acetylglucosamine-1-phosphate transferase